MGRQLTITRFDVPMCYLIPAFILVPSWLVARGTGFSERLACPREMKEDVTDERFGHVLPTLVLEPHTLIGFVVVSTAYRLERYWAMSPARSPDAQYSM